MLSSFFLSKLKGNNDARVSRQDLSKQVWAADGCWSEKSTCVR